MGVDDEYAFAQVYDGKDCFIFSNPRASVCEKTVWLSTTVTVRFGNDAFAVIATY